MSRRAFLSRYEPLKLLAKFCDIRDTKMAGFASAKMTFYVLFQDGGGGRTRTYEGVSQRIYSPPPLPLGTLPRKKRAPDRGKPARAIWSAAESQSIENGPGSPRRPATRKEEPRQRTLGAKRRSHERNGAKFAVILGLIAHGNAANIPYF